MHKVGFESPLDVEGEVRTIQPRVDVHLVEILILWYLL